MTVAELIAELQTLPGDMQIYSEFEGGPAEVCEVEIQEFNIPPIALLKLGIIRFG